MKLLTFIFFISSNILFGQIPGLSYEVNIGKFSYRPKFIYDYKPGKGEWVPGSDEDIKELVVNYPKRTDTIIDYYTKKKIGLITDKYSIDYLVDTISVRYLDTLINQQISITHNGNKCNIYSINIQILYSDGSVFPISYKSNKLTSNKKYISIINKSQQDFYFIITLVKLYNDKNEKLEINNKYGWKVRNRT